MARPSDSGQKFISRNRPPRVQIVYENPNNAEEKIELPFVMGVMADLSGNASGVEKQEVAQRKFLDIDMDNFERRMEAISPGVSLRVANKLADEPGEKLSINLKFQRMEDFGPAAIAEQTPALKKLLDARTQLANLLRYMDGKVAAEEQLRKLLKDPQLMAALRQHFPDQQNNEQ
ncbi:type VI secretion system contractile sheath small subunit [Methylocystis heyeri]|uniref:Type VI secretion system contractile sheath small subunit n=1 Tax=Methylocystis heyeri TaxID=391905 RepID=A0A6B8KL02_9HYPH|nr:type VI secretion system contractile sheath small subunit [Methylocystis heyeri]QGM47273.1 type VI secretion system contractile sheath small subunit [Methylocystis heyeri]